MKDFKVYDQDGNFVSMPRKAYEALKRGYPPPDSSRRPVQMIGGLVGIVVVMLVGSMVFAVLFR